MTQESPTYLHPMPDDACRLPKPDRFTYPFHYTPPPLCLMAADELKRHIAGHEEWREDIASGKMFGVIIVENPEGKLFFMAAYSGILCSSNKLPYFVPPIYDLQRKDCYFQQEQAEISLINNEIERIESSDELAAAKSDIATATEESKLDILRMKEDMKEAKRKRDAARAAGATDEECAAMIKESQFMKAELKRRERHWSGILEDKNAALSAINARLTALKDERKTRSAALQQWLFGQYSVLDGHGYRKSLTAIFHDEEGRIPPAGSGECCAPKLLQAAYGLGLRPLCMAEFWLGKSPKEEIRHEGQYYPACRSKCKPILGFMLRGIEVDDNPLKGRMNDMAAQLRVIYEDEWIAVVSKPSGMLSVPGKEDAPSVYDIAKRMFPQAEGPIIVHRLDMDTSGLMVLAKDKAAHENLQKQFEAHSVRKCYTAILDGTVTDDKGVVDLPLCPNPLDRPRQMVSKDRGKRAITAFKVTARRDGMTFIKFYPQTGRTHQLRVHAAHQDGLGCPIVGDNLYGRKKGSRLFLHAQKLKFTHPVSGAVMVFECEPDWTTPAS